MWEGGFPKNGSCQRNSNSLQAFIYKFLGRKGLEVHKSWPVNYLAKRHSNIWNTVLTLAVDDSCVEFILKAER